MLAALAQRSAWAGSGDTPKPTLKAELSSRMAFTSPASAARFIHSVLLVADNGTPKPEAYAIATSRIAIASPVSAA